MIEQRVESPRPRRPIIPRLTVIRRFTNSALRPVAGCVRTMDAKAGTPSQHLGAARGRGVIVVGVERLAALDFLLDAAGSVS